MTLHAIMMGTGRTGRSAQVILSALLLLAHPVAPATIAVRGSCTLPDAITAANRDSRAGSCPAGSGTDTIQLTGDVDLFVTDNVDNGLPKISSRITIKGGGYSIERATGAPRFRIFDVLPGGDLTLDGVTVANGSLPARGGGIRTFGALTLSNSTVTGNESSSRGGGIYARGGVVMLVGSSVSRNSARRGAGISAYKYSDVTISGSTISENIAASRGGGILLHDSSSGAISSSTISSNSASSGAGIRATFYSGLEIKESTISNNTSTKFEGGGIFSAYSDLTLDRSRVTGNTARSGGGIFTFSGYSRITVRYSTVSGNSASESGGGAFFSGQEGSVSLRNSTISGNSAETGGGIFETSTYYRFESSILHTTISQNTASLGAGIYAMNAYAGYHTLAGSLVAGNPGGNCAGPGLDGVGSNFDDDGTCPNAAAITPGVDFDTELVDNGGPTETHALLEGSPAIDASDCSLPTDQRLFRRSDSCDSGSFEFAGEAPLGASIAGVAMRKVSCKNTTTGQKGRTATSRTSWLCSDLGVVASPPERVRLLSRGTADGTAPVGGSVTGLAENPKRRVTCRNRTTRKKVSFVLDSPTWSCEAQGLAFAPGDSVQQKIRGGA